MTHDVNPGDIGTTNTYDIVPYHGNTYQATHPRHLSVIGKLFGLKVKSAQTARVLEIGCGMATNIIPMAAEMPKAKFVGIDLSERQIQMGQAEIDELGLKNIQLKHMSVTDVTPDLGTFDYIICHGVFSWVPNEVQQHILRVAQENLAPTGIAFVSYNTLPGWGAVRSLRDMMRYHSENFSDPQQKLDEAVRMLKFVRAGVSEQDVTWRQTIDNELERLTKSEGWYVYHEHLENDNHPLYFKDFMAAASAANLRYLGESVIPSMFVDTLPKPVTETLKKINDVVRQEQYMDFIRNRRFRQTLLVHNSQKPNRSVPSDRIFDFYLTANSLKPDFDTNLPIAGNNISRSFGNNALSTICPWTSMILVTLHEQGDTPVSAKSLPDLAAKRFGVADAAPLRSALQNIALQLVFHGRIILHDASYADVTKISKKPKVSALMRHQASKRGIVTNARHVPVQLDAVTRKLVSLLDGSKTLPTIMDEIFEWLTKSGSTFQIDGKIVTSAAEQKKIVEGKVNTCLELLRSRQCLIG